MDAVQRAALEAVSTATLTTVLLKHGISRAWMAGPAALSSGQGRVVGPAFTLRFIPGREDVGGAAALNSGRSSRVAIEEMPKGVCVVVEVPHSAGLGQFAGIAGDILAARMQQRGVAALITDGRVRDLAGVRATGLKVWCAGAAAPPSYAALHFIEWQQPVGIGGVAVFPDDIIVADADGAVVIPAALVASVVEMATEQERLEEWILSEVEAGHTLKGLYPPDSAQQERYARHRRQQDQDT